MFVSFPFLLYNNTTGEHSVRKCPFDLFRIAEFGFEVVALILFAFCFFAFVRGFQDTGLHLSLGFGLGSGVVGKEGGWVG